MESPLGDAERGRRVERVHAIFHHVGDGLEADGVHPHRGGEERSPEGPEGSPGRRFAQTRPAAGAHRSDRAYGDAAPGQEHHGASEHHDGGTHDLKRAAPLERVDKHLRQGGQTQGAETETCRGEGHGGRQVAVEPAADQGLGGNHADRRGSQTTADADGEMELPNGFQSGRGEKPAPEHEQSDRVHGARSEAVVSQPGQDATEAEHHHQDRIDRGDSGATPIPGRTAPGRGKPAKSRSCRAPA